MKSDRMTMQDLIFRFDLIDYLYVFD
jgi:hypothetical protein